MDRTERFYLIDQLLRDRGAVPIEVFLDTLEVSRATFKRDLEYMRDRLHAPIVWDRAHRGYRLDAEGDDGTSYALPGLWFNADEMHALLSMQQLLTELQPGLLEPHVAPLLERIRTLLDGEGHSSEQVQKRVRVLHMAARRVPPQCFQAVSSALLKRQRLQLRHYSRERDQVSEREVSPQRLVHYRDNWYLDAWCHTRKALRSFALDGVRRVRVLQYPARELSARVLDAELGSGYGIFAGRRTQRARLRFSPLRARWVATEIWHPRQCSRFDAQGRYVLEFPFSDPRELVMDILKHGPEVQVLAPESLRQAVAEAAHRTAAQYQS